jgi:hypothetical protein
MNRLRCHSCGTLVQARQPRRSDCPGCGALLPVPEAPRAIAPLPYVGLPDRRQWQSAPQRGRAIQRTSTPLLPSAAADGRVLIVETPIHEAPDFDPCRAITRALWILMLLVAPFVMMWTVLVTVGGFSALLIIAACVWFVFWLAPSNLLSTLNFLALMRGPHRRDAEQVPVRYFRLRQPNEIEVVARLKGVLHRGNIGPGDRVACYGTWRDGVLFVQRAFNHTARSWVQVRRFPWPIALGATLLLLLIGGTWLLATSHAFFHPLNANLDSATLRY